MTDTPATTPKETQPAVADPIVSRSKYRFSMVWFVPVITAFIGALLIIKTIRERGTEVQIRFASAAGITSGKTALKHKNVTVGTVEDVALDDDLQGVIVTAYVEKPLAPHLREGTRFWVVLPRISSKGVSGLGTIISGAYIEMDPGPGHNFKDSRNRQYLLQMTSFNSIRATTRSGKNT